MHGSWQGLQLGALLTLTMACGASAPPQPAPPPRRPEPVAAAPAPDATPRDCQPLEPRAMPPSVPYAERSLAEADNLAKEGTAKLTAAAGRVEPPEREALLTEAVALLITALAADPYDVHATYNLAAAYARVGRPQCTLNLLARLVQLRRLESHHAAVEAKIDRLLGRGGQRGNRDRDFDPLRGDPRFRRLVKELEPAVR